MRNKITIIRTGNKKLTKCIIASFISLVLIVGIVGCSQQESKPPIATQTPAQMQETQRKAAQDYAAYRQSHPAPGQGQQ